MVETVLVHTVLIEQFRLFCVWYSICLQYPRCVPGKKDLFCLPGEIWHKVVNAETLSVWTTRDSILPKLPGQFNLKNQFFIWYDWLIKYTGTVIASELGWAISLNPVSPKNYANKYFHMNYLENWSQNPFILPQIII